MNSLSFASGTDSQIHERGSTTRKLLAAERAKPANCFTLLGGVVTEGIIIELNHPMMGGKPALILGEGRYIMRDVFAHRGALYEISDGKAIVRRAKVEMYGERNIPLLRKIDGESKTKLVHVHFGMPSGMQLRSGLEELWCGTHGGKLVARGKCEALVEMKEGDIVQVFYSHGAVGILKYADLREGVIKGFYLDVDGALFARLELLESNFHAAAEHKDATRRVKSEDAALRGLAAMILMVRGGSEFMHRRIIETAEKLVNGIGLRPGVARHFKAVLSAVRDFTYYGWMAAPSGEESIITTRLPPTKSGPSRAEIEARRATNREARVEAQPKKGPTGQKTGPSSKDKEEGKK
ncbi:MAG: hypothetical protein ABSE76_01225 [Minisyncoccia bacterium]|jgi:hypothetical protein